MKKKPSRLKLIKRTKKENDRLFSKAVMRRDDYKCLVCGKTENLSVHHWYVRKGHSQALAWHLDNGATLCFTCHLIRIHQRADGQFLVAFLDFMRNKVGAASVANMDEIERHPRTLTLEVLQEIGDRLRYAAGDI